MAIETLEFQNRLNLVQLIYFTKLEIHDKLTISLILLFTTFILFLQTFTFGGQDTIFKRA